MVCVAGMRRCRRCSSRFGSRRGAGAAREARANGRASLPKPSTSPASSPASRPRLRIRKRIGETDLEAGRGTPTMPRGCMMGCLTGGAAGLPRDSARGGVALGCVPRPLPGFHPDIRTGICKECSASIKLLHSWIIVVIAKQHLVQIARADR